MCGNHAQDSAAQPDKKLPAGVIEHWGNDLFQNDNDMKVVATLYQQAGLQKLENDANANITDEAFRVRYSMYSKFCRGVGAVKAVRVHLDSGVLAKLAAKQIKAFMNPTNMSEHTSHGYTCVIFAACAMSLGCDTYLSLKGYHMYLNTYNKFLLGIALAAPITNQALAQIRAAATPGTALSFQAGMPYDFGSKTRAEVCTEKIAAGVPEFAAGPCWIKPYGTLSVGLKPPRPIKMVAQGVIGPCEKVDMEYSENSDLCGNEFCSKSDAKLKCGRCEDQSYCNKLCQGKDWGRHKTVCRTPETVKDITENPGKWMNVFDMAGAGPGGASSELASMFGGLGIGT